MSYPELSILIPAAGASKRLGQAKQLARYKTGTLIQNAVKTASSIAPREIIVVTGAHANSVRNSVQDTAVRWVHNPHWSVGIGSSIATGAAHIGPESIGVMILLCDQWRLQTPDLRLLTETWLSRPERIVCAQAEGLNMPPVIFPATYISRLQALHGDTGARSIFNENPGILTALPMPNAGFDLDTKTHLDQLTNPPL